MFFRFMFLVVSFLSFRSKLVVTGCEYNCEEKPLFIPSKVVVKYGDPGDAKCTVSCTNCTLGLEYSLGTKSRNASEILWRADNINTWDLQLHCFYSNINYSQCCNTLDITVYQPAKDVTISFVNHTGPVTSDGLYTLQCSVLNVAPVANLSVTFYKGQTALLHMNKSTDPTKEPVNASFTWDWSFTKGDNGAKFWCEAKLELELEGPQSPPVVKSGNLIATVLYGPVLKRSSDVKHINIKRGEMLYLDCTADGNPPPSYTWMTPSDNLSHNDSVFTVTSVNFIHSGEYICNISNSVGVVVVKFDVTVTLEDLIFIILGVAIGVFLICSTLLVAYKSYKQKRMGQYSLRNVFQLKKRHAHIPVK